MKDNLQLVTKAGSDPRVGYDAFDKPNDETFDKIRIANCNVLGAAIMATVQEFRVKIKA